MPDAQGRAPVLGERVSVRYQLPDNEPLSVGAHFTDVVGELVRVGPEAVTVRGPHGDVVVPRAAVVAVRVVPPRPLRLGPPHRALTPESLQRLMVAGNPPIESGSIGGWLLRAAGGFTGRANSMLALGDPGAPLGEAIDRMEARYRSRGLPPLVTVYGDLDDDLSAGPISRPLLDRGYELLQPTRVMTAPLTRNRVGPDLPHAYRMERVLEGPPSQAFLCVYDDAVPVAVVRVPVHDGWAGLFGLNVRAGSTSRPGSPTTMGTATCAETPEVVQELSQNALFHTLTT